MTTKQLNQRQVRLSEFLSQFNFQIIYRPGAKAILPDTLSRMPGDKPKDEADDRLQHRNRTLIPPTKVDPAILKELLSNARKEDNHNASVAMLDPAIQHKPIDELLRHSYRDSRLCQEILTAMRDDHRRWPKAIRKLLRCDKKEYKVVNGLLYFRDRIFMPDEPGIRLEVTHRTHSAGPAGHLGRVKTLDLLNWTY